MKKITAFQAIDGQVFYNEEDCRKHEGEIVEYKEVNEFLESSHNPYHAGTFRQVAARVVLAWESFKMSKIE